MPRLFKHFRETLFGRTTTDAMQVQLAEMADARQGALYFLGNTDFIPYPKAFSAASSVLKGIFGSSVFLEDISTLSSAIVTKAPIIGTSFGQVLARAGSLASDAAHKLDRVISDFFVRVLDKLASIFGRFSEFIRTKLRSLSPSVLGALVGKIVGCIPGWEHVKAAGTIYKGLHNAVAGAYSLFSQVWSGYDVDLLGGHPSIIANALARHSLARSAGGAKDAAIEVTMTGLTAAGYMAGAVGTVVSLLKTGLLAVVSFLEGMIQKYFVKKSLKEAHEQWGIRESSRCIMYNPEEFSLWFQKAVIPCPILAAISLNSGFLAHPYRFLKLLDCGFTHDTSSAFNTGVKYIEKIKKISQSYIGEYVKDYEIRFVGTDSLVSARLNDMILGRAFPTPAPMFAAGPVHLHKVTTEDGSSDWAMDG